MCIICYVLVILIGVVVAVAVSMKGKAGKDTADNGTNNDA